ncbi:lumican [Cetorhinus maximus]
MPFIEMDVRFVHTLIALVSTETCAGDYLDYGGMPVLFSDEEGDPTVLSLSGRITSDFFRYFGFEDCPSECDCLIHWPTALYCDNRALPHVPLMLPFRTQHLYVQGNCIQRLPAGIFKNTTALKWMILDRNKIRSKNIGKGVFSNLNQLENLYMNYNNLIEIPAPLPSSLKQLRLAHNRITKLSREPFENLENLVMLLLRGNRLTTINGGDMKGLKSIIHLDLSYNQLSVFPKNLPITIQQFYCTNNFFETLAEDCFAQFQQLLYLQLSHNKLTTEGLAPNSFNISTLIELGLSHNNFTSVPHVHKNLQYLYMEANQINEFNITSFCRKVSPMDYSQLRILRLDGNKLTYSQIPSDWMWCLRAITKIIV